MDCSDVKETMIRLFFNGARRLFFLKWYSSRGLNFFSRDPFTNKRDGAGTPYYNVHMLH